VAAIVSGLVSLGTSAAGFLGASPLDQVILAMDGGLLHITAMGSSGSLGALTDPAYDVDNIGYQMGRFVGLAAKMLTPALITELKAAAA
jgi:predicted regulator of Ras-like GTPase activity (Roadblock/LC7/MglB family)